MQSDLKVLLIEDDRELCEEFRSCFAATEGIELSAVTDSATRALQLVRELQPDVVILDLELHLGEGNGIIFLSDLGKQKKIKKPYVIVNTNNSSGMTHEIVRRLGADMVMYKHTRGHSPEVIAEFLTAIRDDCIGREGQSGLPEGTDEEASDRSQLRERILDELNKVSVSPKRKGYDYLADAIEICSGGHVSHVAALVAKKYGKTEKSVIRAMQNAIDRAWDDADQDEQERHFKARISSGRISPTVTEFIGYYASLLGEK